MPDRWDHDPGDNLRLLSAGYVEFFVKRDRQNMALMERDTRLMARAVGSFAFFLMDAIVLPAQHGVRWTDGWVEVDFRARTDPEFRAALIQRSRYRRMCKGFVLMPKRRLRSAARDIARMLCMAYVVEHGPDAPPPHAREAVLEMLGKFRERFCHTGDAKRNA